MAKSGGMPNGTMKKTCPANVGGSAKTAKVGGGSKKGPAIKGKPKAR